MTPEHLQKMQEGRNKTKRVSYKTLIREKCLDCSAQQIKEVRLCSVTSCSLHQIRPFKSK